MMMNDLETRIFQDLSISNFLKAWLICYRFGFQEPLMRVLLMTGFEPWKSHPAFVFPEWRLNEVFCHPQENELSVEEAAYEMQAYFKYFVDCTLNSDSFEVFDTEDGRGLGIRATKLVSLGSLSLELVGFVEIINYPLYALLRNRGYPSLYHFRDIISNEMKYGILFGPLALVNTARDVPFGFSHLNLDGTDSCWRITYLFGEVFEDLGDGVSTIYNRHQLWVNDVDEDEDEDEEDTRHPIQMGEHDRFQVAQMNFAPYLGTK